jgi:hypothetical protein
MAVTDTRRAPATREPETVTERGMSLARGPALVLGTILLAAGLYMLYKEHLFPPFSNFPDGTAPVEGKVFGVFGANGWTGMLTAIAGGLLLFGAAQHLLAKTMSLIVGVGLGAAAVIALISGDVLGLAAANHMTELAWGIAAAILLINTLAPRRRRTVAVADGRRPVTRAPADGERTRVMDDRGTRDTHVMHDRDGTDTRAIDDRDGEDTRVMDYRDGTDTGAMDDRDGTDTRAIDDRDGEDTRGLHHRDHEETDEPFAPDGMETRVMADREDER